MSRRCLGCMKLFGEEYKVCPHCGYIVGTGADEAVYIPPGTRLHDRYVVGKVLGYGGFGVTYIGCDESLERPVAIKEYLPGEFSTRMPGHSQVMPLGGEKEEHFREGRAKFIDEAKRLAKFQNESGIVKVYDSFVENLTAYIIMEFLEGETLKDYLEREGKIPEDKAVEMLLPVIKSLQAVHKEGILHRDISPDNIFILKNGEVKLIDFGAARYAITAHSRSLTVIIKQGYSPEEQYQSRGDQGAYTDVYALGAVLYKMLTGVTPPDALERHTQCETHGKDMLEKPHKLVKEISQNRQNAILNAMNVRIEDRTPNLDVFLHELTTSKHVKLIVGRIKRNPFYGWPIWVKVAFPVTLALILTFTALLMTGVIKIPSAISSEAVVVPENVAIVPDIERMDYEEAFAVVKNAGLLVETSGTVESEYVPMGKVVFQDPIGGTYLDKNSAVLIRISSGKQQTEPNTVPYLVTDTREVALKRLAEAGFAEPTIKEVYDENIAVGCVVRQSIEAGTQVTEDTVLELTISLGPASFELADMAGKEYQTAQADLEALGLKVTVEYENSNTVNENCVISQSIIAGTAVKSGDSVVLTVSSGVDLIVIANVVGKARNEASKTLKGQGVKVKELENYDDNVEAGKVISQSPAAGTSQAVGSSVTIYVSKGKQQNQNQEQGQDQNQNQNQNQAQESGKDQNQDQNQNQNKGPGPWSDWVDSLPGDVTSDKYDIETKQEEETKTLDGPDASLVSAGWSESKEGSFVYGDTQESSTEVFESETITVDRVETRYEFVNDDGLKIEVGSRDDVPDGKTSTEKKIWYYRERSVVYNKYIYTRVKTQYKYRKK